MDMWENLNRPSSDFSSPTCSQNFIISARFNQHHRCTRVTRFQFSTFSITHFSLICPLLLNSYQCHGRMSKVYANPLFNHYPGFQAPLFSHLFYCYKMKETLAAIKRVRAFLIIWLTLLSILQITVDKEVHFIFHYILLQPIVRQKYII